MEAAEARPRPDGLPLEGAAAADVELDDAATPPAEELPTPVSPSTPVAPQVAAGGGGVLADVEVIPSPASRATHFAADV